jgi:hypothetical protein
LLREVMPSDQQDQTGPGPPGSSPETQGLLPQTAGRSAGVPTDEPNEAR